MFSSEGIFPPPSFIALYFVLTTRPKSDILVENPTIISRAYDTQSFEIGSHVLLGRAWLVGNAALIRSPAIIARRLSSQGLQNKHAITEFLTS